MKVNPSGSLAALVVAVLIASGCVSPPSGPAKPMLNDSGSTEAGVLGLAASNNMFAMELFGQLRDDPDNAGENIFFSPYSISVALAMTTEGARGDTLEEMMQVFHLPPDDTERRANFAAIYNSLNKGSGQYQLSTANALWAQQDYYFLDDYFAVVGDHYGGRVTNLDFIGDTEGSRQTINEWVEEQTNDKIKDLLPLGALNDLTRLVLTNAIYFKGDWVYQFDKSETRESDFWVTPERSVQVEMMHLDNDEAKFNYARAPGFEILELPYKGDDISMLILLPNEDLESAERLLDAETLEDYKGMMSEQQLEVYLPKFTFETKYLLKDALTDMGMPTAFSGRADFSGMTGRKDLFISFVIHQAFVKVDEEGTEAAAATGVGMELLSVGNVFNADHPFIFIIQDKETGMILFMGRVIDPS